MKNLNGKVAAITGAGSGIGRALALQLAAKGATVALNDHNVATLAETYDAVMASGGKASTHPFDVSDKKKVHAFAEDVIRQHGQADIVINNAGTSLGNMDVVDVTYEEMEWLFGINLWGVIYGTKAFLPHLLTRPEASIVNISSVFGIIGVGVQMPYSTTKWAVRGFTESVRMNLLDTNICVTQVHPGGIDTNIVNNSRFRANQRGNRAEMAKAFKEVAKTTAAEAARQIIKGIERKKWRVLIGRDARFIDKMARLFPTKYARRAKKWLKN